MAGKLFTTEDICLEIHETSKLIQARVKTQVATSSDPNSDPIYGKMVHNVVKKIYSMSNMNASDSKNLYEAVAGAELSTAHKAMLSAAVDKMLTGPDDDDTDDLPLKQQHMLGVTTQKIENVENYFTKREWTILNSSQTTWNEKEAVVIERLKKLHIHSLSEASVGRCVALLLNLCFEKNLPTYVWIFSKVQDFKATWHAHPKLGSPKLLVYPRDPSMLPAMVHKQAYEHDDLPAQMDCPSLNALSKCIPLRTSSKLLQLPPGSAPVLMDGVVQVHQKRFQKKQLAICDADRPSFPALANFAWHNHSHDSSGSSGSSCGGLIPRPSPPRSEDGDSQSAPAVLPTTAGTEPAPMNSPLATKSKADPAPAAAPVPLASSSGKKTAAEIEEATLNALLAAQKKGKTHAKKMKRPAAAVNATDDDHEDLTSVQGDHEGLAADAGKGPEDHGNKKGKTTPEKKQGSKGKKENAVAKEAAAKKAAGKKAAAKKKDDEHAPKKVRKGVETDITKVSRKNWGSRAYHKKASQVKADGGTDDDVKKAARQAQHDAFNAWDIANAEDA